QDESRGCCDCGDLEAWRRGGMCGRHRPPEEPKEEAAETGGTGMAGGDGGGGDQDYDAVRASLAARERHAEAADGPSPGKTATSSSSPGRETARPLPPRLAAALSCVIGAAVQSAVYACESSASCSDLSQWRLRAADLACRSVNGAADDEDYRRLAAEIRGAGRKGGTGTEEEGAAKFARPVHFLDASIKFRHEGDTVVRERGCVFAPIPVPGGLHLRLHNDDVHTFEDVIRALSARRAGYTEEERDFLDGITPADTSLGPDSIAPLVGEHRAAQALTTRVDAEGTGDRPCLRLRPTRVGGLRPPPVRTRPSLLSRDGTADRGRGTGEGAPGLVLRSVRGAPGRGGGAGTGARGRERGEGGALLPP
ncbi:hypothetical protein THAOC_25617, partial [Thalassiosira oceanica]